MIHKFWLRLQLIITVALTFCAWGLATVAFIGFAAHPEALTRSLPDGAPTWPLQAGGMLVLVAIGIGGVRVVRRIVRRAHQPSAELRPSRHVRDSAVSSRTAGQNRQRPRSAGTDLRSVFLTIATLVIVATALLAGMVGEWGGPKPKGFGGPGTLLAAAAFLGSIAIGWSYAKRLLVARTKSGDVPLAQRSDGRPVLALIWWPIVFVAISGAALVITSGAIVGLSEGTGLPTGVCLVVGVFGFISLPVVVSESICEFGERGTRGFWKAARATEWGNGLA
ncbi:nitrate reductase NapE component [Salinibacterium sp. CAN_S4]